MHSWAHQKWACSRLAAAVTAFVLLLPSQSVAQGPIDRCLVPVSTVGPPLLDDEELGRIREVELGILQLTRRSDWEVLLPVSREFQDAIDTLWSVDARSAELAAAGLIANTSQTVDSEAWALAIIFERNSGRLMPFRVRTGDHLAHVRLNLVLGAVTHLESASDSAIVRQIACIARHLASAQAVSDWEAIDPRLLAVLYPWDEIALEADRLLGRSRE